MKKFLVASALASTITASAFAVSNDSDFKVKLNGAFNFQSAFSNQSNMQDQNGNALPRDKKLATDYHSKTAFLTKAKIAVTAENETDCGLKYGAKITLLPQTKKTTNYSFIFVETNEVGRFELGSAEKASQRFDLDGLSIAAATGDDWTSYYNVNPNNYNINYLVIEDDSIDNQNTLPGGAAEKSRKITYISPEWNGLQLGLSYIPDSSNVGDGVLINKPGTEGSKYKLTAQGNAIVPVRDAVSWAVKYTHDFNQDLSGELAVNGDYGKPARVEATSNDTPYAARHKLNTVKVGAKLSYQNFTLAGSYGTWGKSLAEKKDGKVKTTTKYSLGGTYSYGPAKISYNFYETNRQGNKMNSHVVGTSYELAPGLMPYAEIARINVKGKGTVSATDLTPVKDKRHGTVGILGAKLVF